ncbi:unnamed protein product, partial [Mesorhabditis spiculigera]
MRALLPLIFIFQFCDAAIYTTPIYNATRDPAIKVLIGSPVQTMYCNYMDVDYFGMIIIDGYDITQSVSAKNISVTDDGEFTNVRDTVIIANMPIINYDFQVLNTGAKRPKNKMFWGNCNLFMGRLNNGTMVQPVKGLAKYLDAPILTYYIQNFTADVTMGQMTLGAVDSEHCENYKWYPTNGGESYWNVWFTGAQVGNETFNQAGYGALYLTDGTHNVPTAVLQALVKAGDMKWYAPQQKYRVHCSKAPKMPSLTFFIQGDPMELQWDDYLESHDDSYCYLIMDDQNPLPFIYTVQYYFQRYFCLAINYRTLEAGLGKVKTHLSTASIYEIPIYNTSRNPGILVKIGNPAQTIYCNYINENHYGMIVVDGYDPSQSVSAKNISVVENGDFTLMEDTIFIANMPLTSYRFKFLNYGAKPKMRLVHGNCNLFMGRLDNGTMASPVAEFNKYLDKPIITYYLSNFTADLEMGRMTLGAIDTTHCGAFKWYNTSGNSQWNVKFTGYSIGSNFTPAIGSGDLYLSDGISLAPSSLINKLISYGNFEYDNLWDMFAIPCSDWPANMPDIGFRVYEDYTVIMKPEDYMEQIYDNCYIWIRDGAAWRSTTVAYKLASAASSCADVGPKCKKFLTGLLTKLTDSFTVNDEVVCKVSKDLGNQVVQGATFEKCTEALSNNSDSYVSTLMTTKIALAPTLTSFMSCLGRINKEKGLFDFLSDTLLVAIKNKLKKAYNNKIRPKMLKMIENGKSIALRLEESCALGNAMANVKNIKAIVKNNMKLTYKETWQKCIADGLIKKGFLKIGKFIGPKFTCKQATPSG